MSLVVTSFLAEFTTMAGRRLRRAVQATLLEKGGSEFQDAHIIIAGLTGSYSQYITTFEEYEMQRYEVAFSCCLFFTYQT